MAGGADVWERRVMDARAARASPGHDNPTARRVFAGLPHRYDRLAEWLSFGQNGRWRAALVDAVAAGAPERILDVATGTAGVALALRDRTGARVIGVDLDAGMAAQGLANVASHGGGVAIALARGEQLPLAGGSVDAVSFCYLLRYVDDPAAALAELARVVRPGGVVASLEFLVPSHPAWRGLWWLYTRAVLPVAGALTGGQPWFRVGRFLGPSISVHYRRYPVAWTVAAWEAAGIGDVHVRRMSLGGGLVMWGRRR